MGRGKAHPTYYQVNLGRRKKTKRTRVTLNVGGKQYWEATGAPHLVRGLRINKKGLAARIRALKGPRRSSRVRR
jgi:hypothetical protein